MLQSVLQSYQNILHRKSEELNKVFEKYPNQYMQPVSNEVSNCSQCSWNFAVPNYKKMEVKTHCSKIRFQKCPSYKIGRIQGCFSRIPLNDLV